MWLVIAILIAIVVALVVGTVLMVQSRRRMGGVIVGPSHFTARRHRADRP